MLRVTLLSTVLMLLGLPNVVCGQSKNKQFTRVFKKRSPESELKEQGKHFGWSEDLLKTKEADYKITAEAFNIYVPKRYKKSKKRYGLFVWIAPSYDGRVPPIWYKKLDQHRLIAVGANKSGNERATSVRIGLALDAVFNMTQHYRIDPKRVYVGGFSGGGRMSCFLTMHYPDIFQGGLYLGGCDYIRNVPIPGKGRAYWRGQIKKPSDKILSKVKDKSRHVFLVGSRDGVLMQMKAVRDCASADKFSNIKFIEMPKIDHRIPPAKWFEKSIKYLDRRPLPKPEK
jgi:hypothetical protein